MNFGVPSKKRVKQEKYPNTPVVTLHPYEGAKTSRKIEFNEKAYEVMNFNEDDYNYVAFSFNNSKYHENFVVNTTGLEVDAELKVAKNGIVSNKAHFEEIKGRYQVDLKDTLELKLQDSGKRFNQRIVFELIPVETNSQKEDAQDEVLGNDENETPGVVVQATITDDETDEVSSEESTNDIFDDEDEEVSVSDSQVKEEVVAHSIPSDIVRDEEDDDDLPF